jgi:hypothetical protein
MAFHPFYVFSKNKPFFVIVDLSAPKAIKNVYVQQYCSSSFFHFQFAILSHNFSHQFFILQKWQMSALKTNKN